MSFQQVSALEAFGTDIADERAASMAIVRLGLLLLLVLNDGCSPASFLFGYFNENTHRWSPTTLRENIFITVPQFGYSLIFGYLHSNLKFVKTLVQAELKDISHFLYSTFENKSY